MRARLVQIDITPRPEPEGVNSDERSAPGDGDGDDATAAGRSSPSTGDRRGPTRRRFLAAFACGGAAAFAGCPSEPAPDGTSTGRTSPDGADPTGTATGTAAEPTAATAEPTATEVESVFERLYERTVDSVTMVETPEGTGSGWVFDGAGRIVTNDHVVGDAGEVSVRYDTDEWRTATVLGTDPVGDLAVVEPSDPPDYATPLSLAADPPETGEDIAIIGAPFGLPGSLSVGVVSATDRFLDSPTGSSIPGAIQVDATANPGNSGGPILSADGDVFAVLNSGAGVAVNFGIPARLVADVVPVIAEGRPYRYSALGVSVTEVTPAVARANDLPSVTGVLIRSVSAGGPAAGLLRGSDRTTVVDGRRVPVGGDVVVALDGETVTSEAAYASHLAFETRPGDRLDVTVLRDGERLTVAATLGGRSSVR